MDKRFNTQPVLIGEAISLKPLVLEDFDGLFACGGDLRVWAGHPSKDRYKLEKFKQWFADAQTSKSALTIFDNTSKQIIGSSRYYFDSTPPNGVSIGYTFLAYDRWGGEVNAELKKLMLAHAFKSFDTVWFHVAPTNIRSQKAMEKIGGIYVSD